jgi:hypothetical protein
LSGEKNERKTSSAKNTELQWTFGDLPRGVVLTRGIQRALHGDPTASKRAGEEGLQREAEHLRKARHWILQEYARCSEVL